jgi:S1-C subfamily serine protease
MPGEFDFFNDEPPAPSRPPARRRAADETRPPSRARPVARPPADDSDDAGYSRTREPEARKGISRPLIAGIAIGSLLVLIGGVVAGLLLFTGGSKSSEPKDKGVATAVAPKPAAPPKKEPADQTAPSPEVVAKVKKATVRVLVQQRGKKGVASGSGFVEKDTRLVLTNAHVVGMKSISDPEPLINLIVNSGGDGGEEYPLTGEVVAVDAENDLAVIRPLLLRIGERTPVPDGIVVPKTSAVTELQRLYVFGFPLGDALGSEISIRPTQVTSLRHEGGKLKRIQVEGGMTFGNSGGPVVDVKGNVIGVAVSGIQNANINFCVPGEMVQQLLTRKKEWKKD